MCIRIALGRVARLIPIETRTGRPTASAKQKQLLNSSPVMEDKAKAKAEEKEVKEDAKKAEDVET